MIAVDTSVIVAIIRAEPHEQRLRNRLERAGGGLISTGNLLELQLVMAGKGQALWQQAEALFDKYSIVPRPFDEQQLRIAQDAALRFGKGRHKAGLNFGDCFAYALAISEDIPLLFAGKDFAHTDVTAA